MTPAQLYLLIAPIVMLAVIGSGLAIWWFATKDSAPHRTP
jgi:hypothetical protein